MISNNTDKPLYLPPIKQIPQLQSLLDQKISLLRPHIEAKFQKLKEKKIDPEIDFHPFNRAFAAAVLQNKNEFISVIGKKNIMLNRYSDFYPYDFNISTLSDGTYINCSPIYLAERLYLVTQAPLETTMKSFWKMIIENEVEVIVALSMPVEKERNKTFPYWLFPTEIKEENISVIREDVYDIIDDESERIFTRAFNILQNDVTIRTVTQYHYQHWPDFGSPDLGTFKQLLSLCQSTSSPIVVHCSAGVGRAGTFVAADSLLREKTPVSVFERLLELRSMRPGMVQTSSQLRTIMEVIFPTP